MGMTACAHEWSYVACAGYRSAMAKLAAKMGRDQKERKLGNMDADDTNGAK